MQSDSSHGHEALSFCHGITLEIKVWTTLLISLRYICFTIVYSIYWVTEFCGVSQQRLCRKYFT